MRVQGPGTAEAVTLDSWPREAALATLWRAMISSASREWGYYI